jgi:hypothetical protein
LKTRQNISKTNNQTYSKACSKNKLKRKRRRRRRRMMSSHW